MVYFCPTCNYTMGIGKSSAINKDDKRKEVNNPSEVIKLIENDKNIAKYKANFKKSELMKNKKYQKLSQINKNKLNILFSSLVSDAELKCDNCGYIDTIKKTIKLFEYNVTDKENLIKTKEDNKVLCMDPTLPRTKNYVCGNKDCDTHKNAELKEAIFMRIPKSYNLKYICCNCYYSW